MERGPECAIVGGAVSRKGGEAAGAVDAGAAGTGVVGAGAADAGEADTGPVSQSSLLSQLADNLFNNVSHISTTFPKR